MLYTEEHENNGFPLKDFLLKLLLVVIFVLLLVWLLPKAIQMPKMPENNDLSALTSQLFAQNLETMKEAAINYYTDERLPQAIGDKDTITLRDMIGKKLLVPFVDKHNKACDVDKSYVSITKEENEYLMKVYLSCSEESDYVLVHMGCYTYCEKAICEKQETEVIVKPTPTPQPQPKPDPQPQPNYIYEYKKTFGREYSNWSDWSNPIRFTTSDNITFGTFEFEIRENLGAKSEIVKYDYYYDKTKPIEKMVYREYSNTVKEKVCTNYSYYVKDTTTNTTYAVGGQGSTDWTVSHYETLDYYPADTLTKRYIPIRADFDMCGATCTSTPYIVFKVETRQLSQVGQGGTTVTTPGGVTVKCDGYKYEYTKYYNPIKEIIGYQQVRKPVYGVVLYYHKKTRSLVKEAYTDTKWSYYNDTGLLNNGYAYTGNKKEK